ncbi:HD domain-containing protein [Streptomyces caniscabiei]|uniref:HD domain-containing protein n=1 Tax=Streptomyces caniscabiei TaxID=2746961 RepID=UPI0038D3C066
MWHAGQTRRSGDPFLIHCVAVAAIVADIGMPPPVICAALLHDIDDSPCPPGRVTEHFGQGIADLISAVRTSRLSEIPLSALNFPTARPPTLPPTRVSRSPTGRAWWGVGWRVRRCRRGRTCRPGRPGVPIPRWLSACR